ncbi:MAG TPA: hypothetical protein VD864_08830 [Nocardioides sp.]|nr:hypothetical protein [Nocardioides sp.]
MTRLRIAQVLAVLAALAVLGTAGVALAQWGGDDADRPPDRPPGEPAPLVVRDPRTGATVEVPGSGWRVEDRRVRIYYTDEAGRPVAVVRGPAVFRPGYCAADPASSNRGFVGFTRQPFEAWVGALGSPEGETVDRVTLAGGTRAQLRWARVDQAAPGPCAAPQVYVAMVRAGDVRVVLVADSGTPGTLPEEQVEAILAGVRL